MIFELKRKLVLQSIAARYLPYKYYECDFTDDCHKSQEGMLHEEWTKDGRQLVLVGSGVMRVLSLTSSGNLRLQIKVGYRVEWPCSQQKI